MDDDLLARWALSRASGAPLLACLAGLRPVGPTAVTLALAADAPGTAGGTDLGVLADLALGAGVRAALGLDRRLATASLTVGLDGPLPAAAALRVHVPPLRVGAGPLALAAGTLLSGGGQVGLCAAAFAPQAGGLAPMPWEQRDAVPVAALTEADLTDEERQALAVLRDAPGHDRSLAQAALRDALTVAADGRLLLQPGPLLANRAGAVQGGVLLGLSVHAAECAAGGGLVTAHTEFLAPAGPGEPVEALCRVLRAGRRTSVVQVELEQSGRLVASTAVLLAAAGGG